MKRSIFILFLVAIFSFAAGMLFKIPVSNQNKTDTTILSVSPTPLSDFLVSEVLDGDTIRIETGEKVRYLGIDAPEQNEAYGLTAARYNKQFVLGKRIRLEYDYEEHDQYGRLLAYVFAGNDFINEKMIKEGYAKVYTIAHTRKLKYIDRLEAAETWARERHNGMWIEEWRE